MSENNAFIPDTEAAKLLAEYTEAIIALAPTIQEGLGGVALHGATTDTADTWQEQVFSAAMALRHFTDMVLPTGDFTETSGVTTFVSTESSTYETCFANTDQYPIVDTEPQPEPAAEIDPTDATTSTPIETDSSAAAMTETEATSSALSDTEVQPPAPDELELQVMAFALRGVFRMEELHRAIPSLAVHDNKSPEWAKFKKDFEKMIDSIQSRIAALPGGTAGWRFESRQRGKKYILDATVNGEPLNPEQVAELFPIEDEVRTQQSNSLPNMASTTPVAPEQPAVQERTPVPTHESRRSPRPAQRPVATPATRETEALRAQRRTIDFTVRALEAIKQAEREVANGGILARDILRTMQEPDGLGNRFSETEAERILQSFRNSGDLIRLPGEKGRVKYTTDPTKAAEYSAKRQQAAGERQSKEEERIAELLDTHGDAIVSFLGKLGDKTKSEFKTTIAEKVGNSLTVDDVNPLCRKLQEAGLVEGVMPKGRGVSRKRKGITWRLTNKGRAHADALEAAKKGLSAAQKKQLGNTHRQ